MALKARKADEKTSQEFYLHTGPIPMKVFLFNPTAKEMEEKLGITPNEEPTYIQDDKFNEGQKKYLAYFWMTNLEYEAEDENGEKQVIKEGDFRIPLIIGISDTLAVSASGKNLYINKYGKSIYAESEQVVREKYGELSSRPWFSTEGLRHAYGGEPQFYEFHAAYANLKSSKKETDENCFDAEDIKKLFIDDSFLKEHINDLMAKGHGFRPLVLLKNAGETENGGIKVREIFYNQFYQKTTQSQAAAMSNFESFITCAKITKNVEDTKERRAPKGEFFTYEPRIHTISSAIKLVSSSVDEASPDDKYSQSNGVF